ISAAVIRAQGGPPRNAGSTGLLDGDEVAQRTTKMLGSRPKEANEIRVTTTREIRAFNQPGRHERAARVSFPLPAPAAPLFPGGCRSRQTGRPGGDRAKGEPTHSRRRMRVS